MAGVNEFSILWLFGFMLLFVVIVAVPITIVVLVKQRQEAKLREHENELKMQMVSNGMSAEDIERVIRASAAPAQPTQNTAVVAMQLAEHGMKGEDIAKVLTALGGESGEKPAAHVVAAPGATAKAEARDELAETFRPTGPLVK